MLQKIYVSQVIINNNVAEVAQLVSDGKEGEGEHPAEGGDING